MTDAPAVVRGGTARRSDLFDELVELVAAEGFAGRTLDEIAGRLRCSKRTLYELAGSKERLVHDVIVHFFKTATGHVEAALAAETDPRRRVVTYLEAVARELAPASAQFFDDVAGFPPAAEIYARNTRAAARRVRELIEDGVAAGVFREVNVPFATDMITSAMVRIQNRQIAGATGLSDAAAYAELAELLLHGLNNPTP